MAEHGSAAKPPVGQFRWERIKGTAEGICFKTVGAGFKFEGGAEIFIAARGMNDLRAAWAQVTDIPLNEERVHSFVIFQEKDAKLDS